MVEFCWRLPQSWLFNGRNGKMLLRKLLYRLIPPGLLERPKHGFDFPLDDWLRSPLRSWMLDLLNVDTIRREGYLDDKVIAALVAEHLSGHGDHGYALWPALMFQSWLNSTR
jgi:asparagine synthase (glutamine-hydrolysing)